MSQGPKLVAVQHQHPRDPERDIPAILSKAARSVADGGIAVLPEYFWKPKAHLPEASTFEALAFAEQAVLEASQTIEGALVATVPEIEDGQLLNTAIVAEGGKRVHRQPKVRPTPKEREAGVVGRPGLSVAEVQGLRLGVLVCADVLALDLLVEMAHLQPDVVAVPVLSPNRGDKEDPTRGARTSVFIARAWDMGAYIVKAGGFDAPEIVGRSLITAPWGLEAQARRDDEATLLATRADTDKLARVRRAFEGLGEAAEGAPP